MKSQILRFNTASDETVSIGIFSELREAVARAGAVSQYFGYSVSMRRTPVPKRRHEITWLIQWPAEPAWTTSLRDSLKALVHGAVADVTVEINGSNYDDLLSALDAPVCEVVVLRFNEGTPIMSQDTRASVHKSYTDCYKMLGFVGGDWGFATNTTSVEGHKDAGVVMSAEPLPQKDRLLSVYILGWESIELHEDATQTALFAEELTKLGPHVDSNSGACRVMNNSPEYLTSSAK